MSEHRQAKIVERHDRESSLRKWQWRHLAAGPGSARCADGGARAEPQLRRADFAHGDRTIPSHGRKRSRAPGTAPPDRNTSRRLTRAGARPAFRNARGVRLVSVASILRDGPNVLLLLEPPGLFRLSADLRHYHGCAAFHVRNAAVLKENVCNAPGRDTSS